MSLDINFNKSISTEEIKEKTTLKVVEKDGSNFLEDQYGNVVFFKDYGITLYGGPRNPTKILDELIKVFDIKFIDDSAIDMYDYEPDKYENIDLFIPTMLEYGYLLGFDGKIVIPEREESDYLPYKENSSTDNNQDLPF
jgi:hypothetical protein